MNIPKSTSFVVQLSLTVILVSIFNKTLISGWHLQDKYKAAEKNHTATLQHEIRYLTADFTSKIEALKKDAAFLAHVPPIRGIIRATESAGQDAQDASTLAQWQDRLSVIFKEMLAAKPEYLQLRYIGVADEGRELVRVDRRGLKIEVTPIEQLQKKAGELYFQKALKVDPGTIYLSDFTFNREWGKVVEPKTLVIRAVAPIYYKYNQIYGMVVVNMQANAILSNLLKSHSKTKHVFLYDRNLKQLVSSLSQSQWTSTSSSLMLQEGLLERFFKAIDREHGTNIMSDGEQIYAGTKIYYDDLNQDQFLGIAIATSKSVIWNTIKSEITYPIGISIALILLGTAIIFLFVRNKVSPLHDLKLLAQDLASGRPIEPLREEIKGQDEISVLTRTFHDMADKIQEQTAILNLQKEALDETALVSETDPRGRITYANNKFADIAGYTVEELIGSDHRIINSGYHPKEFFKDLWTTIAKGKSWRGEVKNKSKEGDYYWVDSSIVPFKDLNGKILKYISIRFDITDKKRQEQRLKELTAAKSNFLATMSHEIRTPLSAVIGINDLLASSDLDDMQRDFVNKIGESANMLLAIINDILDLSKLESGKIEVYEEPTNIWDFSDGVFQVLVEKAQEKHLVIDMEFETGFPKFIAIDQTRVKQVMINLISNAIKFTERGRILVRFERDPEAHSKRFCLTVSDTGIGIPREKLGRIFNEFEQVDSSTTKTYGGTGLGLAICKKISEALGGSIEVESELGRGSKFILKLPLLELSDTEVLNNKRHQNDDHIGELRKKQISILIAEDYQYNQLIFKGIMSSLGFAVTLVDNGYEAVSKAKAFEYDLIFLDIQMPVMDGLEALKSIRSLQNVEKRPWIIAFTANVYKEDIDRYLEAGFDDYLAKPFRKTQVVRALNAFAVQQKATSPVSSDASTSKDLLDLEQIEELRFIGEDFLVEQCQRLRISIGEFKAELELALSAKDKPRIAKCLHAIKGVVANTGFKAAHQLIQNFEPSIDIESISHIESKAVEIWSLVDESFDQIQEIVDSIRKSA